MHKTDDVVERSLVHGNARALGGREELHGLFEAGFGRQGVHVRARNHDFTRLDLSQLDRALDELHFGFRNQTAVARLLDHHLEFLGGAHKRVAVRRDDPQGEYELLGDSVEQVDCGTKRLQEPVKRSRNEKRYALGAGKAEALRYEFAQHDLQKSEKSESENECRRMGQQSGPRLPDAFDEGIEDPRQRHFAKIAEQEACDRYPDLHARYDAADVAEEILDDLRPRHRPFHSADERGKPARQPGKIPWRRKKHLPR